jgi:hypothetical protein
MKFYRVCLHSIYEIFFDFFRYVINIYKEIILKILAKYFLKIIIELSS